MQEKHFLKQQKKKKKKKKKKKEKRKILLWIRLQSWLLGPCFRLFFFDDSSESFFKWKSWLNFYKIILNIVYAMILLLLIIIWSIPLRLKFFLFFLIKLNWLMSRRNTVKIGIFALFLTNLLFPLFSFTFTLQSTLSSICIVISSCTFSNKLLNKVVYLSNHMYLLCKWA